MSHCQRFCIFGDMTDESATRSFQDGFLVLPAAGENEGWMDEVDEIIENLQLPSRTDGVVILAFSYACGWAANRSSRGIIMRAPDGVKLELPRQGKLKAQVFRAKLHTVVRHGVGPESLRVNLLTLTESIAEKFNLDPDRVHAMRDAVGEYQSRHAAQAAASVPGEVAASPEPAPASVKRKRRIVRQEPWSAHSKATADGVSQTYPSQAVIERTWSDGFVDFLCQWEGCDKTGDNPRSIAAHYASAHTRGDGRSPLPPMDGIDPDHNISPRKRTRIAKLRRELESAMTAAFAEGPDPADPEYAVWIATWIIEHRVETTVSGDDDTPIAELDNEQILDRIAALVDRGRSQMLREQINTLHGQMSDYEQQVHEATEAVTLARQEQEAAEAKATKAIENLKALRGMINELPE